MKKLFFLAAFVLLGSGLFAQMTKADVTAILSKCDLTSGEFTVWHVYAWSSQDGLYTTYSSYDLANCTITCMESGISVSVKKGEASSVSFYPYVSISHLDYSTGSDGKHELAISLL